MAREIVKVDAKTKAEAIMGLKFLLETIQNNDYDGEVCERVLIVDEGIVHSVD